MCSVHSESSRVPSPPIALESICAAVSLSNEYALFKGGAIAVGTDGAEVGGGEDAGDCGNCGEMLELG